MMGNLLVANHNLWIITTSYWKILLSDWSRERNKLQRWAAWRSVFFHEGETEQCHNSPHAQRSLFTIITSEDCRAAYSYILYLYNCSIRIVAGKKIQFFIATKVLWQTSLTKIGTVINYYNLKLSLNKILVKNLLLVTTVSIIARNAVCRLVWKEKIITTHIAAITETTVSNLSSFQSFTLRKALCTKYATSYKSNTAHPTAHLQLLSYLEFSLISLWKHSRKCC